MEIVNKTIRDSMEKKTDQNRALIFFSKNLLVDFQPIHWYRKLEK